MSTKGLGAQEVEENYTRALELCAVSWASGQSSLPCSEVCGNTTSCAEI